MEVNVVVVCVDFSLVNVEVEEVKLIELFVVVCVVVSVGEDEVVVVLVEFVVRVEFVLCDEADVVISVNITDEELEEEDKVVDEFSGVELFEIVDDIVVALVVVCGLVVELD